MTRPTLTTFLGVLLAIGAGGLAHAQPSERAGTSQLAQAQPNEQDKSKHKEDKKGPPPGERKGPPPGAPKAMVPPTGPGGPPSGAPPAGKNAIVPPDKGVPTHKVPPGSPVPSGPPAKAMVPPTPPTGSPPGTPPAKSVIVPPDKGVAPTQKLPSSAQPLPPGPVPGNKPDDPSVRKATEQPFDKKKAPDAAKAMPQQGMPAQPPSNVAVPPGTKGPSQGTAPGPAAALKPVPSGAAPRLEEVQKARKEHVEGDGRRVIEEPGNRIIVKMGDRIVIRHDEAERFRRGGRDVRSERRPDGFTETFYVRPDGIRIVSVTDGSGRLLRRYRRGLDGREISIIDNRRFYGTALAVGVGTVGLAVALNLAQPRITIPRELYIVDYERASDDDLYVALTAPPVDTLERAYSLEEVRDNYLLRDRMRRIDLDGITFEFGAFEVTADQYPKLERIGRVMLRVLKNNPDEVFLVEGHTDAVGNDVDNLSLSDRRAEAVAGILSDAFGVPPENLVTQGYGKQFLKIDTPAPERLNRRVAIRRITPLISER
ncbi:MAG: OmpA family protein [Hyphomicrobiaceae bacterium]|nr:OmpA family protein [Hyphomicrobiaceae bacterium]